MSRLLGIIIALCALSACTPILPHDPVGPAKMTARERGWYDAMGAALDEFPKGGGYSTRQAAFVGLTMKGCQWNGKKNVPVFRPRRATPSFCSAACYLLLLKSLQNWDATQPQRHIDSHAWAALMPGMHQKDGDGCWGWANANGPGLAVLVHALGAGINFQDWKQARPGDFMKIFWTEEIGRREFGHLTVLVKDYGDRVSFWSANMPDGYGVKTVLKSNIKRVIFTRITRPEQFNKAPSIGYNPWLANLLKKSVTPSAMRKFFTPNGEKTNDKIQKR